ncbi:MAG: hypothetical protein IID15_02460, partial [Candidatus Marinimicrobia bacterium]|nr:hypothetical protein [Candidatus Neomarinimicrobiota bacterium]
MMGRPPLRTGHATGRSLAQAASILGLMALMAACSRQPELSYQQHRQAAGEAHQAENYKSYLRHTLAAQKFSPHHQGLIYNAASGYALLGQPGDAIAQLRRLAAMGLSFNLMGDQDFRSLTQLRAFQTILTDMALNRVAIVVSRQWMVVAAPEDHLEGIAYDPVTKRTYFGAVRTRKILYQTSAGAVETFSRPEDSLMAVLGLRIDVSRRILWAATSALSQMENFTAGMEGQSALVAFNLDTGEKLRELRPAADDGRRYGFNDLAIASDGTVYVSGSRGTVWFLPPDTTGLRLLFTAQESFQGLALSGDDGILFAAAYGSGIWRFDLAAQGAVLLPYSLDASLLGVDGLAHHNGYLIGVQNGLRPYRILKMELSAGLDSITAITVVERNHPDYGEPTLGQI